MPRLPKFDPRLYLVTDPVFTLDRPLIFIVEQALQGGVTMVQYRNKQASSATLFQEAQALRLLTKEYHVPLIINDYVDVVVAVGADGVHLGQDDASVKAARATLGKNKIIGVSIHSKKAAQQAEKLGADYVSASPVFATTTKPDAQAPLGIHQLQHIVQAVTIPVVAIGGITLQNLKDIQQSGVAGIAVVTALTKAPDVKLASQQLLAYWKAH